MEVIRLYDTLSREVCELPPGQAGRFRLYVCGPTVYGPAHIGNFLTFIRFDVLFRLLQLAGYKPLYVRNITDVDDKTIRGAMEAGVSLEDITSKWTERFHTDCRELNLLSPDVEPRATDHIREQIDMVQALVDKGHAYVGGDGSVYYKVASFGEYGKLSHFDPDALRQQSTNSAGSVNLSDEYERDSVADFALWKSHKEADGQVCWDSPWGKGRPGWHLECSAMSLKYLGNGFELHGGGEDLCFPHHENEIAQSEAVTGKPFATHWMHSVHLLVEGKKMSKSLGNFFVLQDLVDKGFHPAEVRLAMLGGHYRQQLNFTFGGLESARSGMNKLESGIKDLLQQAGLVTEDWESFVRPVLPGEWGPFRNAWEAFRNDMNTPAALGAFYNGLKKGRAMADDPPAANALLQAAGALAYALGLQLFARRPDEPETLEVPAEVEELARNRWEAKKERDFTTADRLREELAAKGWLVVDTSEGYTLHSKP